MQPKISTLQVNFNAVVYGVEFHDFLNVTHVKQKHNYSTITASYTETTGAGSGDSKKIDNK